MSTIVMLPPQRPITREWAARLASALPDLSVVVAETEADAARAIDEADAAFGTLPDALLARVRLTRPDGPDDLVHRPLYVVVEKLIGAKKHAPEASPAAPPALAGHGHGGH